MLKVLSIPVIAMAMIGSVNSATNVTGVNTSSLDSGTFFGGWGHETSFVEEGVLAKSPGHDTVGDDAWSYATCLPGVSFDGATSSFTQNFSLKNNDSISFRFSVDMFTTEGEDNVIGTHTDPSALNDIYYLDIYAYDKATRGQLALLRIYTDSGSKLNQDHSSSLYGSDWSSKVDSSYWLKGTATMDSSFYIQFDKENVFSSYAGGQEGIVPIFDLNNETVKNIKNSLQNVDEVVFQIKPNNGWSSTQNLLLREINGQSLASVDGVITDNVGPTFNKFTLPSNLSVGDEITLDVSAHDVLSEVNYAIEYDGNRVDGLTFTPTKAGQDSATIYAIDASGNETEYVYNFEGISTIEKPTFVSLPTIEDKEVNYYDNIVIDAPQITDVTGVAKISLSYGLTGEEKTTIEQGSDGKFTFNIGKDFKSGEYEFIFDATNSAGTTTSQVVKANITLAETVLVNFIDTNDLDVVIDYDPNGLRMRTRTNYQYVSLGVADLNDRQTLTFEVPFELSNGGSNNIQCFEWRFVNLANPDYYIGYRNWLNQTSTNFDAPTNVIVHTPEGLNDIENCGWISYGDNPAYRKTQFVFDPTTTAYFHANNHSGVLTPAQGVADDLTKFFEDAPKSLYAIQVAGFDSASSDGPLGKTLEYRVTELNNQSFANENGVINKYEDPIVKLEGPTEGVVNNEITLTAFVEDYFLKEEEMTIESNVIDPNGIKTQVVIENNEIKFTPTLIGEYTFNLDVIGSSKNKISKSLTINITQEKNPITITLNGSYPTTLKVGEKITILDATYSDHANPEKTKITLIDMENNEKEVHVGDEITFDKPGMYSIKYFASDDALPENNTSELVFRINVLDENDPVVTLDIEETYYANEEVTLKINATDETELTYNAIITSPSGERKAYSTNEIKETFTETGVYTIRATVVDLYDNTTTVNGEFTVVAKTSGNGSSTPNNNQGLIIGLSVGAAVVVVAGVTVAVVLTKKKKGKK